jgi:hypothetical protein
MTGMFMFWSLVDNINYSYKKKADWMSQVWITSHPPFRILRQQIIRTLVRNRIIT